MIFLAFFKHLRTSISELSKFLCTSPLIIFISITFIATVSSKSQKYELVRSWRPRYTQLEYPLPMLWVNANEYSYSFFLPFIFSLFLYIEIVLIIILLSQKNFHLPKLTFYYIILFYLFILLSRTPLTHPAIYILHFSP
jgi:hypothetical protein